MVANQGFDSSYARSARDEALLAVDDAQASGLQVAPDIRPPHLQIHLDAVRLDGGEYA